MTTAERYVKDILSEKVIAGEPMIKAAQRFADDRKRKDIYFDEEDADRYCDCAEKVLCIWEGEFRGENIKLLPFQKFIIQNIFGWKLTKNNKRRFVDGYIQTSKKQGKTTLMAAIAWMHLLIDESESTPQIIVNANNEDQAKICVNSIGKMVDVSPILLDLERKGEVQRLTHGSGYYRIKTTEGGRDGFVEAISKDPKSKAGKNPSLIITDEFMAAPNDLLLKELRNAQVLRSQPLSLVITTPGFNKQLPCYSKLRKRAMDTLNKTNESDNLFVAIFEPNEDLWEDEREWIKSAPIIEHWPNVLDSLRSEYKIAKQEGGTSIVDFKTKNLGLWCDTASVWIPSDVWILNHRPQLTIKDIEGRGYGGLDLSATRDITSFGAVFPEAFEVDGKTIAAVVSHNWLPHDNAVYRGMDYTSFIKSGHIKTTPDNYVDYDVTLDDIAELLNGYDVRDMYYDKYLGAFIPVSLAKTGMNVVPISMKGFIQSEAMKKLEIMATAGELEHFNNPVLKWAMGNTVAKFDPQGRHIRPEREHENNKIDPAVALILAFQCWQEISAVPEPHKSFVISI